MNREELDAVLKTHRMWLEGRKGGKCADLRCADLQEADLRCADLQEADLRCADLQEADLQGANLREADLDFASWPLWCGTRGVRVDVRIFRQLAMHLCGVVVDDDECRAAQEALMPLARQCHRADEFLERSRNEAGRRVEEGEGRGVSFQTEKFVRGKNPHVCGWCGERIVVGEKHVKGACGDGKDLDFWRLHVECYEAMRREMEDAAPGDFCTLTRGMPRGMTTYEADQKARPEA